MPSKETSSKSRETPFEDVPKDSATSLRAAEWALAGSMLLILLSLFVVAKIQARQCSKGTDSVPIALVTIQIAGFVEHPGVFEVARGAPLEEVLRKARPKRFANLRGLDLMSPLLHSMELTIEPLQSLRVQVKGAVEKSESIEVALGTRICHLKKIISLAESADLTFFKKRRLLSDGDVIDVPEKYTRSG
jgi:hypothetical protein